MNWFLAQPKYNWLPGRQLLETQRGPPHVSYRTSSFQCTHSYTPPTVTPKDASGRCTFYWLFMGRNTALAKLSEHSAKDILGYRNLLSQCNGHSLLRLFPILSGSFSRPLSSISSLFPSDLPSCMSFPVCLPLSSHICTTCPPPHFAQQRIFLP